MGKFLSAELSEQGIEFLSDSVMYAALTLIAKEVGVTAEEYLIRFEKVLRETPEAIMSIFQKQ